MNVASLTSAIALLSYVALMIFSLRQNRRSPVNRAFALFLLAMVIWQFAALMVSLSQRVSTALLWYRFMTISLGGHFIFYLFFLIEFLHIEKKSLVYASGWVIFLALIASGFTDLIIASVSRSRVTGLYVPEFGKLVPLLGVISYGFLAYGIYNLVRGYRLTRSVQQQNRIKYLLLGAAVIALGSLSNLLPILQVYPVDVTLNLLNAGLIAYAILRHRLLDISLVFRKSLLYSIPTAILGAAYFLLISLIISVFNATTGSQIFTISFTVAILAAIAIQPLRDKAQNFVDRIFFREKYNSSLMLQRLSHTAATVLNLDSLTNMILDEVTKNLHVQSAAFFLRQEKNDAFLLTIQRGMSVDDHIQLRKDHPIIEWLSEKDKALTRTELDLLPQFKRLWIAERKELEHLGAELYIPIRAKGELVGVFTLGPKLSEQPYSEDEELTLTTLANQSGVAIENARLYWDLEKTLNALRQAHNELEDRVKARTLDLAQANLALQAEVSERKRAEEAIKRYTAELERSNNELQQFAYVASHDLQEPLRMVSSFLQLLEKRYVSNLDGEAREFIGFAVDGAKRMQALINDLLMYSRVSTRGNPFTLVDCGEVLDEVLGNLTVAVQESQAKIIFDGLPSVMGDGTQLAQVFQNLISNAIKFRGQAPPVIHVTAEHEGEGWLFGVADNGIGIEKKFNDRIFMIFQRLHTREDYPGTGIGLAICKRIVERHGGRIWVDSTIGEGSTFRFTIPDRIREAVF